MTRSDLGAEGAGLVQAHDGVLGGDAEGAGHGMLLSTGAVGRFDHGTVPRRARHAAV
ncbi:hypothetical protein GCM10017576_03570 [Microbacterium barkeri]|uniref:Uncharacterized protein n=1 Tax=Microbacterium barkeri TaxID=33917 RepID=A0A9W6H0W6_9MICO|nr:hypothetical protein GCM10017576_03570 [Microbacterium barkeri]